jgi:vitellogenic carboxypeptidase-like protein
MKIIIIINFLLILFENVNSISNCDPLILTPYIETQRIDEARSLSSVKNLPNAPEMTSYSGFFTVNKQFESNLFFWFFPAMV